MKNKTVKIYTLYQSLNFGAFFQAYALQIFLSSIGYNVEFCKINNNIKSEIKNYIIRKDIRKIPINYIQYKKYKKVWPLLQINNQNVRNAIACIVGSDEIWNIKNNSFYHAPEYFGYQIDNKNIISYAPSSNLTTKDDLKKFNPNINFEKFSSISVRDKNSQLLVHDVCKKRPIIVLDPTMLLQSYNCMEVKVKVKDKYILVYGYKFSKKEIREIKKVAKNSKLKLYSIGMPLMWCDKQITATPFEFLAYINNAEFVITETFHGTIFSILYNKNFVSYVNEKPKLKDLLEKFDLLDRDVSINHNLDKKIHEKIDYHKVNKILKKERSKSINWLIKAIED